MAVTMNNGVFWDVTPCGSARTDVSEELSASFIRVTRIGELGTTLAVTSNQHTLHKKHDNMQCMIKSTDKEHRMSHSGINGYMKCPSETMEYTD
jgi:hypothetical protein